MAGVIPALLSKSILLAQIKWLTEYIESKTMSHSARHPALSSIMLFQFQDKSSFKMTYWVTLPHQVFHKNHLIAFKCHSLPNVITPRLNTSHEKKVIHYVEIFSITVNITFMENLTKLITSSSYVLEWPKELQNNSQIVPGTVWKGRRTVAWRIFILRGKNPNTLERHINRQTE